MSDKATREKNSAAVVSLLAAAVLTGAKLAVGLATNSLGLLSEALHSGLDVLAALLTLVAVRMAACPPDGDHAYGHGKVENLAALAETGLLLCTSFWIIAEGVKRVFFVEVTVTPSLWAVGVILLSLLIDSSRAFYLRQVARKHQSRALEADALHFMSDMWSSLAVLAGTGATYVAQWLPPSALKRFLEQADALAALLVAVIILHACWRLARQSVHELLDGGCGEYRRRIEEAVRALPGVSAVRQVRVRGSGATYFADFIVSVDPYLLVEEAHDITEAAEDAVRRLLPGADVTVHVEAASGADYASPVRLIQRVAAAHRLHIHHVQWLVDERGQRAELHVELPAAMTLARAQERLGSYEAVVRALLPRVELMTHLEPEGDAEGARTRAVTPEEAERCRQALARALRDCPELTHCHHMRLYRNAEEGRGGVLSLCLHGCLPRECTVAAAHACSVRLERALRARMPELGKIVLHMEALDPSQETPAAGAEEAAVVTAEACGGAARHNAGAEDAAS